METERQRVAADIAETLGEMEKLAKAQEMGMLAYLIEMARLEAEDERTRQVSPWQGKPNPR